MEKLCSDEKTDKNNFEICQKKSRIRQHKAHLVAKAALESELSKVEIIDNLESVSPIQKLLTSTSSTPAIKDNELMTHIEKLQINESLIHSSCTMCPEDDDSYVLQCSL